MTEIAAVLDSADLAGIQAGKKGHKGRAQGAAQAGFLVALMSRTAAQGLSKGKAPAPGEVVANAAASGEVHPARSFQPAASPPAGSRLASSQPIASPDREDKQLRVGFPVVEGESGDEENEWLPGRERDTEASAGEAERPLHASPAEVLSIQLSPGSQHALAIQASTGNPVNEAAAPADEERKDALALPRGLTDAAKIRAFDPGKPGVGQADVPANAAGERGNEGQELPTLASNATKGEPTPLQVTPGNNSNSPVQAGSTSPLSSPEASAMRPFDQSLRQIEARLNISVEAHVKTPAFASEFGEKMVWLAGRQGQVAEMILNPPQLGSVEIRLTVAGGEAGAHFFSANPAVREAIEAALPKLRDLMAQAGINLGEANVRDQPFTQGKGAARSETGASGLFPGMETAVEGMGLGAPRSAGLGLVDLYA